MADGVVGGSFRDPSGSVFRRDGIVYRQVNARAIPALNHLESSGLYHKLVDDGLLVAHEDASIAAPYSSDSRVIRPEQIPFISYPYEWCHGQLKDAALTTLKIQLAALEYDMSLKDASAFNIQFLRGRPVLIDTLSFEVYREGEPWVAYRQFCEHFLGPLLLMSTVDPWLGRLSALTADGIPLHVTSQLLPWRSWLSPSVLIHVHLHARSIRTYGGRKIPDSIKSRGLSRPAMRNLVEGLKHMIDGLTWSATGTEWADYDETHGYASDEMAAKRRAVAEIVGDARPSTVWDLGANTGEFSRIAAATGAFVVAMDLDAAAVERNYRKTRTDSEVALHPLWMDLRNPSTDLGWAGTERDGLGTRAGADLILALALVHHLAIGANVPMPMIMSWFSDLAKDALVEFVPKQDPQVQRLLVSREDIFSDYSLAKFEQAAGQHYSIARRVPIGSTGRILYYLIGQVA